MVISLLPVILRFDPYAYYDGITNRYMWFLHICFGRSLASLNLTANLVSLVCTLHLFSILLTMTITFSADERDLDC